MVTQVLAVIPARGGSKGIPRKNIRDFAGWPLIAWSIAAAQQAQTVTRLLLSTDDEEIAALARQYGAETPFLRPAEFARDDSTDLPLFQHALGWLAENEGYRPEVVVQLRPTSPIRPRGLVDSAVRILLDHPDADSVRGVVPAGQNPHKMWRIPEGGGPMKNLLDVPGLEEPYNAPRQALPPVYWQTGHVDAVRTATVLNGSMSGRVIYPVMIDPRFTVDIDNLYDWARYEHLALSGGLDMVNPGGGTRRRKPETVRLVVTDFDGVITDGRVWVDEQGRESVVASRSDSMRIRQLREHGVEVMILSSEVNPVVGARARKMGIEAIQGVDLQEKGSILRRFLEESGIDPAQVVYVGNDFNDLPCFEVAGWAVAVADAYPEVRRAADHVLQTAGGYGALRELCDLILSTL